ncbi:MAG: OmpA family protein [Paludibacteraceae bacterium]|nr:OmpA family protein [Paludibacteraceae bacterium]
MRLRSCYIILLVLLCGALASCGIKSRIKYADKKYAIGEYYDAADIYKQVIGRINPKKERTLKAQVAFNQGECYRILNNTRATSAYKMAIRYHYPDSIVYLHYAQALQYQGKYAEAQKNYAIYLQTYPYDYVAQAGQFACEKIEDWRQQASRYRISLAKEFNQKRSSSFAPSYIGSDADAIMFTSNRQTSSGKKNIKRPSPVTGVPHFQLFTTRKNAAGKWEEIDLPEGLYNDDQEATEENSDTTSTAGAKKNGSTELGVSSFSADGRTMYFTYSSPINGQDQGTKVCVSSRASGEWGEPQEIKLFGDSSITVGHPSVNLTGDTLYFVSDAPGGYGGKDIYMAELDGSNWTNVQNLGPKINTSADEMFPCIHPDGSLYFSSNGHPGYGGLDLFRAERDTMQSALDTVPVRWLLYNLGAPFNSHGDDFGITFAGNSQNGFFSSNRGQKKGYDEIYSFYLPAMEFLVEGLVTDNNGEKIADASIRLVGDDGTNSKIQVRRDGTYTIQLNRDVRYAMLVTARGYLNEKQLFSTGGLNDSKTYTQNFSLSPVSKPVTMDNVFYEFGKWNLTPASEESLQGLVKLLNDNPNITIELSAHTDMVGDSLSNLTLSGKRAESVVKYLVEHGIEPERLTPVGYGKNKPVVADKALHDKHTFIPIEQALTPEFVLTLPKEQQEICNQINRRTEFKVLKTTYKLY